MAEAFGRDLQSDKLDAAWQKSYKNQVEIVNHLRNAMSKEDYLNIFRRFTFMQPKV